MRLLPLLPASVRPILNILFVLPFFLHTAAILPLPVLDRLESLAYDLRMRLTATTGIDPRIVVVDIDEASLRLEGQWPWGRDRLAALVDALFDRYNISLLGFDVVFAEAERNPALALIDRLRSQRLSMDSEDQSLSVLRNEVDNDRRFAKALTDRPVILGLFMNSGTTAGSNARLGSLPAPILDGTAVPAGQAYLVEATGHSANLELLQANALGAGFFNSPLVDDDGIYRRVPMLIRFDDGIYPHLSLAMAHALLGQPPLTAEIASGYGDKSLLEALVLSGLRIPVDAQGAALVPYFGAQGRYPYVAAADVLAGKADPAVLDGAIVLVGTSAAGLVDLRPTPVASTYPGVEINANLLAGILDQNIRHRPAYAQGLEMLTIVVVGLFGLLLAYSRPVLEVGATALLLSALVAGNLHLWHQGMVVVLAPAVLMLAAQFALNTVYGFFIESRRGHQMAHLFGQYVPPELVTEMARSPEAISLEGQSRDMTVLFSDVAGFTTISEGLSPRELSWLMQELLTPLTSVIHQHRGTIDKYIGDAIMAFWGAPLADPEHPRHAVHAALAMVAEIERLGDVFVLRGWPRLSLRIGIHSGVMNVGNMGSEFRMAYTVLGDAVNLASRLEGTGKMYGVPIVISEATRLRVPEVACLELDRVRVKGRSAPVTLYRPVALQQNLSPLWAACIERHHAALEHFLGRRWQEADALWADLQAEWPDERLFTLYRERIVGLMAHPPADDWDGVVTLTEK